MAEEIEGIGARAPSMAVAGSGTEIALGGGLAHSLWWNDLSARQKNLGLAVGITVFSVVYYAAFRLSFTPVLSYFWIPDSILLCTLLRAPPRYWWIFLVLTVPIRLLGNLSAPLPIWFVLTATGIDAATTLAGCVAVRTFTHDPSRLSSWRDWLAMGAILLVAAVSAFLLGAALRHARGDDYWQAWQVWFLGNAVAQLIITPALLTWLFWKGQRVAPTGRAGLIEASLLFVGMILTTYLAYSSTGPLLNFAESRFFLPIPFLYWAALRFGMAGASIAVPVITFFALNSVLLQHLIGVLQQTIFLDPRPANATPLILARFLLFRTLPAYVVAGLVEQRHRAELSVRESETRFRVMANTAPVLVWMSGTDKLRTFFNQVWLDFTGRPLAAGIGQWLEPRA